MEPDRLMVFIDGANLVNGARRYDKDFKVDYKKLISYLAKEKRLIRPYFYDAVPEPLDKKKGKFLDMLRINGITIKTKQLKYKHDGTPYQKGVDVSLVTDMLSLANENSYDLALVISGDNDYASAIEHIKSKGKKVWVASFRCSLGEDIMRVADKVILLDKITKEIKLFSEKS